MRPTLVLAPVLAVAGLCSAQCPESWVPWGRQIARAARVHAIAAWDPDGPGPSPEVLIAGGDFHLAGEGAATNIALWDGQSWSAMGEIDGVVTSLAVLNGNLYASNEDGFDEALWRWNGQAWQAELVPGGRIATVHQGELIIDPYSSGLIAYNGSTWRFLNGSCGEGMAVSFDGGLVNASFGHWDYCISRWDGSTWTPMEAGLCCIPQWGWNGAMANGPLGLFVSGSFGVGNGYGVARWDGQQWQPTGISSMYVFALHYFEDELIAAGAIGPYPGPATSVARWNGSEWIPLTTPGNYADIPAVTELCTFRGQLIAAGQFSAIDGTPLRSIARWDGQAWQPLGRGLDIADDIWYAARVEALHSEGQNLYVGGYFQSAGGTTCDNIAHWSGTAWDNLAGGVGGGSYPSVYAITRFGKDLIVGGNFKSAGGEPVSNIAAWDGARWRAMGNWGTDPVNSAVWALAMYRGLLYAGGRWAPFSNAYGLARWNGASWELLQTPAQGDVTALAVHNDELCVGGYIGAAPGGCSGLIRWNGSQYLPVGFPGQSLQVFSLAAFRGALVVGGAGTASFPHGVISWNGLSWNPLGSGISSGQVFALAASGDRLLVAGSFTNAGGIPVKHVAIWNGSAWSALGSGIEGLEEAPQVYTAVPHTSGFAVGGSFWFAGGQLSPQLALWRPGPPACLANCDCSSGTPVLTANDFQCFLNSFAAQDPYANCDNSTGTPSLTANDFQCFLNAYAAGCP